MEKVTGHPRLHRRGAVYYLRIKVPADLIDHFVRREIKQSLGTKERREALALVRERSVEIDRRFAEARRRRDAKSVEQIPAPELVRIAAEVYHEKLDRHVSWFRGLVPFDREMVEVALDEQLSDWLDGLHRGAWSRPVEDTVASILEDHSYRLRPDTFAFTEAHRCIAEAVASANRAALARADGSLGLDGAEATTTGPAVPRPDQPHGLSRSRAVPVRAVSPASGITVRELIGHYLKDPARSQLSRKTRDGYANVFRLLRELLGPDTPVRAITRDDCRRVRDVLASLPPNATKRFPGKTAIEAAEMAAAKGLPPISATSANSYLNNLAALFNWAVREEYLERNPATGLRVAGPKVRAQDKRHPFTAEQLQAIFTAPLYTGCRDDGSDYARPRPNRPRRGRFWVPLLSLWTGMRLNECCQLDVTDVRDLDGVPCIVITDSGGDGDEADRKRIKTDAGERFVPVHPELVRIGFLEYVEARRRARDRRLFPDLTKGTNGYYSDPFSKWFGRFLATVGIKGPRLSFHSFRHSYRDALREADISRDRVRALGGWASDGGTEEVYGRGYRAVVYQFEIRRP